MTAQRSAVSMCLLLLGLLICGPVETRAQEAADSLHLAVESSRDMDSCAVLLERLGWTYYNKGFYPAALDYGKQAERCYAELHDDVGRARACRLVGNVYRKQDNAPEVLNWLTKSVRLDMETGNLLLAASYSRVLGGYWRRVDNLPRAMESYEQAVRLFEEAGAAEGLLQAYWNMAQMHTLKGDFTGSMKYYRRSLEMARALGSKPLMAQCYWFLGVEHDFEYDKTTALLYMDSCLALRRELGDPRQLEFAQRIMAAIYTNKGDYAASRALLERNLPLAISLGDTSVIANNYYTLGRNDREEGNLVGMVHLAQKALRLLRAINSRGHTDSMLRKLGTLYSEMGKYDSAMVCFEEARMLMEMMGRPATRRWHYEAMAEHYARTGDYARAVEMQKRYMTMSDSTYNPETYAHIDELTAFYESDRRERRMRLLTENRIVDSLRLLSRSREIERQRLLRDRAVQEKELLAREQQLLELELARVADSLQLRDNELAIAGSRSAGQAQTLALQNATIERQRLLRTALFAGILLLALLTVLLLRNLRKRRHLLRLRAESSELKEKAMQAQAAALSLDLQRKEHQQQREFTAKRIASQEQERKRIAGALHDGIGQDLLIIKHRALMAMEYEDEAEAQLGDIMQVAVEAVEDLRRLCRDLRPYQLERVGLTATLRAMFETVDRSSGIALQADIGEVDGLIPPEREIDLYRVLQEAVNNMLKHAEAHTAVVRVERTNGNIAVRITDDGKGFDAAAARSAAGMGLMDMTERVQLLGGSMHIDSAVGKGTSIDVLLPVTGRQTEETTLKTEAENVA